MIHSSPERDLPASAGAGQGLRGAFLRQAAERPDAVALVIGDRCWTYAEIEQTARRWASRLLDAAGGHPRRVGIFTYRTPTAYIGTMAILLAGAAFVPLNPRYPAERTSDVLTDANVDAVLVDSVSLPRLGEVAGHLAHLPPVLWPDGRADSSPCPIRFDAAGMLAEPLQSPPSVGPDDIAYLLFTSGSTGRPKGVPIAHANVLAFLEVNQRRYRLTPDDRLSQTFDQTFDLSIFDMFMAWSSGAAVCVPQPIALLAPFKFIESNGVSVWFSVPSVASLMLRKNLLKPGIMPTLRWSLFCGEALPRAIAEAWQAAAPASVLENLYGPTELTVACSAYRWDPARSADECVRDIVPIGRLYDTLSWIVVDEQLTPALPEEGGELCVAGPQTFPGYWRDPALTAERVVVHRSQAGKTERYYRTGDMVRRQPGGDLVFLGRADGQIKIDGHRIELQEVEAVLRRGGAADAVALPWPNEERPEGIVAFALGTADAGELLEVARRHLPNVMVPRSIRVVQDLPYNANGKVDRGALRRLRDCAPEFGVG
jgi:amino acid adenylation domain-containing protein